MANTHRIRTAVVPAAGSGTRMLPATKAVPKELLPILERPAIQFIVDEVMGAGVEHLVIVTSRTKPAIEDYFAPSPEVEAALERQGRGHLADQLRRMNRDLQVSFVYQDVPLGLGHAVGCARPAVGSEPFFVLLPDEIMADASLLHDMADIQAATDRGVVAVKAMERRHLPRYGIVTPVGERRPSGGGTALPIAGIVEKPEVDAAPSDLAIIGRYALTADIFDILAEVRPGPSGEIQLTDALNVQADAHPLTGFLSEVGRWDVGHPRGWLEAVITFGLADPEVGDSLRQWLADAVR